MTMSSRGIRVGSALLRQSYEHCRQVARLRARNFYHGIRLSPEPQRSALYCVYAWMRQADDLADSAREDALEVEHRIAQYRALTLTTLSSGSPAIADDGLLWPALADVHQRFGLEPAYFCDMLDGQLEDIRHRPYPSMVQLREYCRRVASTVGLICIDIWGYSDVQAPRFAAERGIAFQLTNILRDIAEDHHRNRSYIPLSVLQEHGVTIEDVCRWSKPQACQDVVMTMIRHAERAYQDSMPLDDMIGNCGRPTLWAMTAVYRGLLEKMAADPSSCVRGRVRLSPIRKGAIALRARLLSRASASRVSIRNQVQPANSGVSESIGSMARAHSRT